MVSRVESFARGTTKRMGHIRNDSGVQQDVYFSEQEGYSVSWRAKLFAKNYKHKSPLLDPIRDHFYIRVFVRSEKFTQDGQRKN